MLVVVVIEDVCCTEPEETATGCNFKEAVACIGGAEVVGVFGGVGVGVANKGTFGLKWWVSVVS